VNWAYELTHAAQKDLKDLPGKVRALDEMASDPFQGDVKLLRGMEWKGIFRRRIGSYRFFSSPTQVHELFRLCAF
jgi:mRNA-degrading endonuclease RelE of RelBE toxin-antitoxin system